jgi:hypothetical protein
MIFIDIIEAGGQCLVIAVIGITISFIIELITKVE